MTAILNSPTWFQPSCTKNITHSFWLNLMMAAIMNSTILDSAILVFPLKHTHTVPRLVPTICTKKTSLTLPSPTFAQENFTHSFWLNLMMVAILNFAILNSAILDSASALWNSDTLFSSLRFTQKHSPSTLTLTQTNSFWLKLIHSHWTWMTAILNSAMLDSTWFEILSHSKTLPL